MAVARPVFLSYARAASRAEAQALADQLGELAFLDTSDIEDGDQFPDELLDALLGAKVVIIFASGTYLERRFCRLELRLALAAGPVDASHLVLGLGEGAQDLLDAMPAKVAKGNWPEAAETKRLAALVRQALARDPASLGERIDAVEAQLIASRFLEDAAAPPPGALSGRPVALPPGLPQFSLGSRFVGRADDLRRVHRALRDRGRSARVTSRIAAGGGYGKTRLAIEYVHRYAEHYPGGVFWVTAASQAGPSQMDGEFYRVLQELDPTVPDLATMRAAQRDIGGELARALRRIPPDQPALYVVDNIPEAGPGSDPRRISTYCPAADAVTVLATSRQDIQEEGVQRVSLETLSPASAVLLLTESVTGASALKWAEWERVAEWVGHLPLALDLLNRLLVLRSISPGELLRMTTDAATPALDAQREALRGQVPKDAVRGVTEAFHLSFELLDADSHRAAVLLAQLGPTPIPEAVFQAMGDDATPAVRAALTSRHFLTGGGGAGTDADPQTLGTMHRLMADYLRTMGGEAEFERACQAVARVMEQRKLDDPRHWPLMNLCRAHAEALYRCGIDRGDSVATIALTLGAQTAYLIKAQGDLAGARAIEEQVLAVQRRVLGEEHPDTLTSMNNLASTMFAQGDLAGARAIEEQVLAVQRRVLGEEHPDTLTSMNNLAETMRAQGDLAGARAMQEEVLAVQRRVLGEEHPDTLTSMNNLALTLSEQGDLAGARAIQEQVVTIFRRVLGEEHPSTLTSMNNLASTMSAQGDLAGARAIQEEVLAVQRRVLGEEHPDTLTSMNNLAMTMFAQGDLAGARAILEQALARRRRVLGEEHPDTLTSMNNLASTRSAQGDLAGARTVEEQLLAVLRRVLGEEHPDTLGSMNNLARTMKAQGDLAGARAIDERVLAVSQRVLGEEHPKTLMSMNNLAVTCYKMGDRDRAIELMTQAAQGLLAKLGPDHPYTKASLGWLAQWGALPDDLRRFFGG